MTLISPLALLWSKSHLLYSSHYLLPFSPLGSSQALAACESVVLLALYNTAYCSLNGTCTLYPPQQGQHDQPDPVPPHEPGLVERVFSACVPFRRRRLPTAAILRSRSIHSHCWQQTNLKWGCISRTRGSDGERERGGETLQPSSPQARPPVSRLIADHPLRNSALPVNGKKGLKEGTPHVSSSSSDLNHMYPPPHM